MRLRRVTKIEHQPGVFLSLPQYAAEQETDQALYTSSVTLTGADYEYDLMGAQAAPKRNATERLAFRIVEDEPGEVNEQVDALRAALVAGARFKLWTEGEDTYGASEERWAYARVASMPRVRVEQQDVRSLTVAVLLSRLSDWYGETPIAGSPFGIVGDPEDLTVVNGGTARVRNAVLTLEGTFSNPVITNLTNGYRVESTRTSAEADLLRFDAGRPAVERSEDGGLSWSADYGAFVRASGQVQLMVLEPGVNELRVTGVSSGTLSVDAYPAWH